MLKDISLGQYFPGDSVIHRLDPRAKLIFLIAYIVALFVAKTWVTYSIILLILVAIVAVSGISVPVLLKGLKPLTFLIIFTAVLNLFYSTDGNKLVSFWVLTITDTGLIRAAYLVLRILLLISGTLLLTYTTTPMALTDGMEKLMRPLKKIRFPVHELTLMMSIALRFIPSLIEDTDRIMSAQKARGANFETGKLTDRARALIPLLIPLFVSAFLRADELAVAMESRCYNGGVGRTRMNELRLHGADFATLTLSALILAAIIILTRFGI